jgi:hypothetical protein
MERKADPLLDDNKKSNNKDKGKATARTTTPAQVGLRAS